MLSHSQALKMICNNFFPVLQQNHCSTTCRSLPISRSLLPPNPLCGLFQRTCYSLRSCTYVL